MKKKTRKHQIPTCLISVLTQPICGNHNNTRDHDLLNNNNNNNNNNNLSLDIPRCGLSCPLFPGRIEIWKVGFCGEREAEEPGEKPSEDENNQ